MPNKRNIKETIISYDASGKEHSDIFEIDIDNYVTFYSTTSESEDLLKEKQKQNVHLSNINSNLKSKKTE